MKEIVNSKHAPEAIGPYSQAVRYGDIIYCSGQIGLDPENMELAEGDIEIQARQVMKNIGEVLEASGSGFSHVLKCSIFLAEMDDFGTVNDIYGSYFENDPPARETIAVKKLPKSALVEISCIAAVKE